MHTPEVSSGFECHLLSSTHYIHGLALSPFDGIRGFPPSGRDRRYRLLRLLGSPGSGTEGRGDRLASKLQRHKEARAVQPSRRSLDFIILRVHGFANG